MKQVIKHKGVEWVWCGDMRTNQYRYVDDFSKVVFELRRQYLGLWGSEGYYWLVFRNGVQVSYFKELRSGMYHVCHMLKMEREKNTGGCVRWIHADKPDGSTWFLAMGFAPYVELHQAKPRGVWKVKDVTVSRKYATCRTFQEAKAMAMVWLTERELAR